MFSAKAQGNSFSSMLVSNNTGQCPSNNLFTPNQDGISISPVTFGPGVNCQVIPIFYGNTGVDGEGWSTAVTLDTANQDYFEIALNSTDCSFKLDSFVFYLLKDGVHSPRNFAFYYAYNNAPFQPIGNTYDISLLTVNVKIRLNLDLSTIPLVARGNSLKIRMYGWNAGTTAGGIKLGSNTTYETRFYGRFTQMQGGSVSGSQNICTGSAGTLSLSGYEGKIKHWEYAYAPFTSWNTIGNANINQNFANHLQDTRYRAIVGCGSYRDSSAYAELTWAPATATISGNQSICTGPAAALTVQLTGYGPWDIDYTDGTNYFSETGISSSPHLLYLNPAQTSTYTLTQVSNSCGNMGTVSGNGIIHKGYFHTTRLSGDNEFCGNTQTVPLNFFITGQGPWDIEYTDGTNIFTLYGINNSPYILPVNPAGSTTYSLVSSMSGQCPGTLIGSASIGLHPIPSATISIPSVLCLPSAANLTFQLTGTPPWDISWTDGSGTFQIGGIPSSPLVINIPAQTSLFTVLSVQDAHCTGIAGDTAFMQVSTQPAAILDGASVICEGQSTSALVNLTGNPPWSLTWSDGSTSGTSTGILNAHYLLSLTPAFSSTYSLVQVQDSYCTGPVSGTATVEVLQNAAGTLFGDTIICAGTQIPLTFQLSGSPPWTIHFSENGNPYILSGLTQSPHILPFSPAVTTEYIFESCQNVCYTDTLHDTIEVQVHPLPEINFSVPDFICEGEDLTLEFQLSGNAPWTLYYLDQDRPDSVSGITQSPYIWNYTGNDSLIVLNFAGLGDQNCVTSLQQNLTIPVLPIPEPDFSWLDSNLIVYFNLNNLPGYDSVHWSFGQGADSKLENPVHEYTRGDEYLVNLTLYQGACKREKDSLITVRSPYLDYLVVYDNPNDGDFRFAINYLSAGNRADVALISRDGTILYHENIKSEGTRILREVKMKNQLPAGIYFLRVINKYGIFHAKILTGS